MRQVPDFQAGAVLAAAFSAWRANPLTILALAVMAMCPLALLEFWFEAPALPLFLPEDTPAARTEQMSDYWASFPYVTVMLTQIAGVLCSCWLQAALTYLVVRSLRSGRTTLAETMWQATLAAPRAAAVATLVGFITAVGFLLLFVPGVVFFLMFAVAIPAAVVERRFGSALPRSHELTRGYKWPVLGMFLITAAIVGMFYMVVVAAVAGLGRFVGLPPAAADALVPIVGAPATAFYIIVFAVCYHDLRVLKDGAGDSAVAKVFG